MMTQARPIAPATVRPASRLDRFDAGSRFDGGPFVLPHHKVVRLRVRFTAPR